MFERHVHVAVRVERTEGAKLCILQEQHGLWSQTHGYHGDDVGVLQLIQDGHLWLGPETAMKKITGSSQLGSAGECLFLHLALYHDPRRLPSSEGSLVPRPHFCAYLVNSNLGMRLV